MEIGLECYEKCPNLPMISRMKKKPHWDIISHLSDRQNFKFENKVFWHIYGEIGILKTWWWRYKRLNPMEGYVTRSSKIVYAFTLYLGNLLLGIFPKIHLQNYEKMYAQSNLL